MRKKTLKFVSGLLLILKHLLKIPITFSYLQNSLVYFKNTFNFITFRKSCNVIQLRSRYTNLYIPSDCFNAEFTWTDAFPLHRHFHLGNVSNFHVMNKEVNSLESNSSVLEPPDADHLYSAKVRIAGIVKSFEND